MIHYFLTGFFAHLIYAVMDPIGFISTIFELY